MVQPRQRWCSKIQVAQTASAGLAYDFFRFLRRPLVDEAGAVGGVEVHWYQEPNVGKVEWKVKEWISN